jgi:hypothetical protein
MAPTRRRAGKSRRGRGKMTLFCLGFIVGLITGFALPFFIAIRRFKFNS